MNENSGTIEITTTDVESGKQTIEHDISENERTTHSTPKRPKRDPAAVTAEFEFLTVSLLAKRWCVSPSFVRRLIWSSRLASTRFDQSIRIAHSEIERFENEAKNAA